MPRHSPLLNPLRPVFRGCGALVFSVSLAVAAPGGKTFEKLPRLEVSDRLEVPPDRLTRNVANFYGIYERHSGRKVGWMSALQKPAVLGGKPVVQFLNSSEFVVKVEGQVVRNTTTEEYFFDATRPHALLQAKYEERLKGFRKSIRLKQKAATSYAAEIVESGERRTQEVADLDLAIGDFTSPALWAVLPVRRPGDCFSTASFDFKDLTRYAERHKFLKSTVTSVDGGTRRLTEVECEDLKDRYKSVFTYDDEGTLRRAVIAGATELRLEPAAQAREVLRPTDVFSDSIVPVDKPLGEPNRTVTGLKVVLRGNDVSGIPGTALQKTETAPDGRSVIITVGRGAGSPVPATDEELKSCIQPTAQLPIHDMRVQALAREAAKGAKSPAETVRRLLARVNAFITDDYSATPLGLLDLLKLKRGDCTEHALLFNALARAAGIPCREASGYLYLGDSRQGFGGHAWCEVVLDGKWHPVDPTWNQFDLDAAHIHLSSGPATLRDARFLSGGLKMELLDVVRTPRK